MRSFFILALIALVSLSMGCDPNKPPVPKDLDGTWTQLADPNFSAREDAVCFVLDNKAYVGCGKRDSIYLNDFYVFDGTSWNPIASLPGAERSGAVAFASNNKGYVGLGQSVTTTGQQNVFQDFWEYNPSTNSWSAAPAFPGQPRYHAASFEAEGEGHVATGINASANRLKDVWRLNNSTNNWVQMADFPDGVRIKSLGTSILDNGFLFGGTDNNNVWEYNKALDTWAKRLDLEGPPRDGSILFTIGSKSYYGMGAGNGSYYTDLWEFDFHAYLLEEQKEFAGTGRKEAIGFSLNNKGYLLMGGNNSDLFSDFWEFKP